MSQPVETYCSAVNDVTCAECPLAHVSETIWQQTVKPDATPLGLGNDVEAALMRAVVFLQDEPKEPTVESEEEPQYKLLEDALQDLDDATLRVLTAADRHPVVRQLNACLGKIVNGECATYLVDQDADAEPEVVERSPFEGVMTFDVAAQVVETTARHGSDEAVAAMMDKLDEWAAEQEATFPLGGSFENREILLAIAQIIRSMSGPDQDKDR